MHIRKIKTRRGVKKKLINPGNIKKVRPVYVVQGKGTKFKAFYKAPGKKVVDVSNSFPVIVEDHNDEKLNASVAERVAEMSSDLDVLGINKSDGPARYELSLKKKN
jgi:hypothetical protein